jgi:uncharacterized protein with GYD domain
MRACGSQREGERPYAYLRDPNELDRPSIRNVKDSIQRYDRSTELASKHGVSFEQVYWTVGPHDLVAITQAPDVESVSAFFLELSSAGNLKTTTLPAFNRDEMSSLLQRLG